MWWPVAGHARRAARYERAMHERLSVLRDGVRDPVWLDGLETTMAEEGVAVTAARLETIYANLGERFSTKKVKQEITSSFAGAALALLLAACVLALLRMGRLP